MNAAYSSITAIGQLVRPIPYLLNPTVYLIDSLTPTPYLSGPRARYAMNAAYSSTMLSTPAYAHRLAGSDPFANSNSSSMLMDSTPAAMAHAAALMPRLLAKAGPMMRLLDVIVSTCKMLNPLH